MTRDVITFPVWPQEIFRVSKWAGKKKSYFQIFNTHLGVTINLFLLAGEVFKYSLTQQLIISHYWLKGVLSPGGIAINKTRSLLSQKAFLMQ